VIVRELKKEDKNAVEEIFPVYWTDPVFLKELSDELTSYLNEEKDSPKFFVSEEDSEILGIVGYKKIPEYLKVFAKTDNPVELYVIAVKHKRKGIGSKLKAKLVEAVKETGFSEVLLFSPESHKESWSFHDTLDFKRVGEVTPPDDDLGHVWSKVL